MAAVDMGHADEPYSDLPEPDYSDCEQEGGDEELTVTRLSESSLDDVTPLLPGITDEYDNIPEPDYPSDTEEDDSVAVNQLHPLDTKSDAAPTPESPIDHPVSTHPLGHVTGTVDEVNLIQPTNDYVAVNPLLIEPKKLQNAYVESRQHKILHKELLMKQKGGQLLNAKPELMKKMDERKSKLKEEERKKSLEGRRSSFDMKMEEQARKLVQIEKQQQQDSTGKLPEFLRVHSKIVGKSMSSDT